MKNLDDLLIYLRDVLAVRFPDCDWASIVIHTPDQPNTVLVVNPRAKADAIA